MTTNGTTGAASQAIDLARVEAAAARVQPYIRRTPTERSEALGEVTGRELSLKLENLQLTGAFKVRGALSRLLAMPPELRAGGVITASAGNHGLGVALAARLLGISATVVVPTTVPLAKLTAIQRQGADRSGHPAVQPPRGLGSGHARRAGSAGRGRSYHFATLVPSERSSERILACFAGGAERAQQLLGGCTLGHERVGHNGSCRRHTGLLEYRLCHCGAHDHRGSRRCVEQSRWRHR